MSVVVCAPTGKRKKERKRERKKKEEKKPGDITREVEFEMLEW